MYITNKNSVNNNKDISQIDNISKMNYNKNYFFNEHFNNSYINSNNKKSNSYKINNLLFYIIKIFF